MNILEFIINYWYIILAAFAVGAVVALAVYHFFKLPTEEQKEKVRAWLLWAVIEAEKALGSGTGQLKLRQVYDLFVARFTWLAKVIPFSTFSDWVDDALVEMRELLDKDENVAAYVEGDPVDTVAADTVAKVGL